MSMFCYQCEQTAKGTGCTVAGVCGKDARTAALQDLLMQVAEGVSQYAHAARQLGVVDREADVYVVEAMFSTVTNVDFDPERLAEILRQGVQVRERVRGLYEQAARKAGKTPARLTGPATIELGGTIDAMVDQAQAIGIAKRLEAQGPDVTGLQELLTYGLKGRPPTPTTPRSSARRTRKYTRTSTRRWTSWPIPPPIRWTVCWGSSWTAARST